MEYLAGVGSTPSFPGKNLKGQLGRDKEKGREEKDGERSLRKEGRTQFIGAKILRLTY